MPSGGVRLDGGPVLSENEASVLGSDVSSVISISDYPTDSDGDTASEANHDLRKYRMPDGGKTRLHLRTKEPLSPTPRLVMRSSSRQGKTSVPTTPRTIPPSFLESPGNFYSPSYFAARNRSMDALSDAEFGTRMSRAGSIYTLGRASFSGQLAQLTNMRLPDADDLLKGISSIAAARDAVRVLGDAYDQIRKWINKASEVLSGLNAEDDVEWAAAGGREGIEDVDDAIKRFEKLVDVYVLSIERLQTRDDVVELTAAELRGSVKQMEGIIYSWQSIKDTLGSVKEQVEMAMEWERLWNTVLGEVAQEIDALNRVVFEMEEKRHDGAESLLSHRETIDLNDLETIIEERPNGRRIGHGKQFSIGLVPPLNEAAVNGDSEHEGTILALFARMQPLRAAMDFLPMRLATFDIRGRAIFPTASADLEARREALEKSWTKLKSDANALRGELGEDRWIAVFRNAGRQALKMLESIARSVNKIEAGLDADEPHTNLIAMAQKVESYEAKKTHYGPAIERVLSIIDRGVADRLTLNGEVLRLQVEMRSRWRSLQAEMEGMGSALDEFYQLREKQLRDSVSTVLSSELSRSSSHVGTPSTSPSSSIVGPSRKPSLQRMMTPTPQGNVKTRRDASQHSNSSVDSGRRGGQQPASALPIASTRRLASKTSQTLLGPPSTRGPSKTPTTLVNPKPRWVTAPKLEVHSFLPLSALEPSPYAKTPRTPRVDYLRASRAPASAPPGRREVSTPLPDKLAASPTTLPQSRKSSLPVPRTTESHVHETPVPSRFQPSPRLAAARRSMNAPMVTKPIDGHEADTESPAHHKRPPSAMRLPKKLSLPYGHDSDTAETSKQMAERPRWRG